MEELNNEIAITNTNEDFVLAGLEEALSIDLEEIARELREEPVKVNLSELTPEEQDIYNFSKVLPMDRLCALYGIHKETVEAILNKVK
jgi:hypothetical protein